jgi:3-hydroxyacyl-[acyl-carrier-protein] dehydratase
MENVRFRGPVRPGDRLVLVGKAVSVHRRQSTFNVQGFVGASMVFHADVIGVPMKQRDLDAGPATETEAANLARSRRRVAALGPGLRRPHPGLYPS